MDKLTDQDYEVLQNLLNDFDDQMRTNLATLLNRINETKHILEFVNLLECFGNSNDRKDLISQILSADGIYNQVEALIQAIEIFKIFTNESPEASTVESSLNDEDEVARGPIQPYKSGTALEERISPLKYDESSDDEELIPNTTLKMIPENKVFVQPLNDGYLFPLHHA